VFNWREAFNLYTRGDPPPIPPSGELSLYADKNDLELKTIDENGNIYFITQPTVFTTGTRPLNKPIGFCIYDSDIRMPIWYDGGGQWRDALANPV
jgi:hypothetical protein